MNLDDLRKLLAHYPAEAMTASQISNVVNSPKNDASASHRVRGFFPYGLPVGTAPDSLPVLLPVGSRFCSRFRVSLSHSIIRHASIPLD